MSGEPVAADAFAEDIKAIEPFFPLAGNENFQFFTRSFRESLARDAEFSFAPCGATLEITIQDKGIRFHEKIDAFMTFLTVPEEQREKYRTINDLFPGTVTLLKVDFQSGVKSSLSIYYQTQVSVKLAARISRMLGLQEFPGETLFNFGSALGRKGVFVGLDFKPEAPPSLALFYLIAPRKAREGIPGILSCMESLGMGKHQKDILKMYHQPLTELIVGDLFISFLFTGKLHSLIKIDYDKTTMPLALKILRENDIADSELRRIAGFAQALDTAILNYFGMKYQDNSRLSFKCYFKRDYTRNGNGEMEKVARFLESTVWRFE
jgi:hypothetical protein